MGLDKTINNVCKRFRYFQQVGIKLYPTSCTLYTTIHKIEYIIHCTSLFLLSLTCTISRKTNEKRGTVAAWVRLQIHTHTHMQYYCKLRSYIRTAIIPLDTQSSSCPHQWSWRSAGDSEKFFNNKCYHYKHYIITKPIDNTQLHELGQTS